MLWLFWRFPIPTAIATAAVLGVFALYARMASATDADAADEMDHHSDTGFPTR
jgi:hypothetical protein